jgi:hypothetical protein
MKGRTVDTCVQRRTERAAKTVYSQLRDADQGLRPPFATEPQDQA